MLRKIDNKVIQVEGEIYWEVDTGAGKYTHCISAEGKTLPLMSVLDMTLNNLMRFQ